MRILPTCTLSTVHHCDAATAALSFPSVGLAHIRDDAPQLQGSPWLQELLPGCVIPLALLQLDGEEVGEACVAPAAPQPAALQVHTYAACMISSE